VLLKKRSSLFLLDASDEGKKQIFVALNKDETFFVFPGDNPKRLSEAVFLVVCDLSMNEL
jgi:hypothetical protein